MYAIHPALVKCHRIPQKAILTISHIYDAKDPRVSKFNVGKNEKILVSQKALHFEL